MYVDQFGNGYYFDSYGAPPSIPNHINRLRQNCKYFRWNTMRMQSENSDACGQYCVMFSHFLSNGFGMHRFKNVFSTNYKKNDKIVKEFYDNLILKNAVLNQRRNEERKCACFNLKKSVMNCKDNCCKN